LHYVFLPRINQNLEQWRKSWNHHKIRTEANQTPLQLFVKGMIECGYRGMEDENVDPNEYGIDWEGPQPSQSENDENTVFVDESQDILTQNQMSLLRSLVDPLQEDNGGHGINVYDH
jgi:hypothetical protein